MMSSLIIVLESTAGISLMNKTILQQEARMASSNLEIDHEFQLLMKSRLMQFILEVSQLFVSQNSEPLFTQLEVMVNFLFGTLGQIQIQPNLLIQAREDKKTSMMFQMFQTLRQSTSKIFWKNSSYRLKFPEKWSLSKC